MHNVLIVNVDRIWSIYDLAEFLQNGNIMDGSQ